MVETNGYTNYNCLNDIYAEEGDDLFPTKHHTFIPGHIYLAKPKTTVLNTIPTPFFEVIDEEGKGAIFTPEFFHTNFIQA